MARSRISHPGPMITYHGSRPLLEYGVRRSMRAFPNVAFLDEHDFVGLVTDPDRCRITGVRVAKHSGNETVLQADLVVDATGRGSRTPVFLRDLGYDQPPLNEVEVRIAYATLPVRIPHGVLHELFVSVFPVPDRPTIFAMLACEDDTYMVTGGTVGGQDPPADRDELLDFISKFAPRHVVAAVRAGEPLDEVSHYRLPSNRWRRYDKLARTPAGLLVFGDAICSFNPIYGQGMTIAAIEAEILRDCLSRGACDLAPRFYRQSAKAIRTAWRTAVSSDLALPQVPGRRPLSTRLTNAYMNRVLTATETDPVVAVQFLRVVWMIDRLTALLRPPIVLRIAEALVAGDRSRG
jgi:2-polyprenyl-6-methoxyphenol hydroxylase-like FAD-dependent oxidoreductase